MTWQRIDENTFIDETLVTCAEYQLFLDEMREQGKYYQPDHWTSFQFPKGQGQKPILGVRYLDVVAFCEWLTKEYGNNWLFRIPSNVESGHNLSQMELKGIGFWIKNGVFVTKTETRPYPNYRHLSKKNIRLIENAYKKAEQNTGIPNSIATAMNVLTSVIIKNNTSDPLSQAQISTCLPLDIERYFILEQSIKKIIDIELELQNFRADISQQQALAQFNFEAAINDAQIFSAGDDHFLMKGYAALFDELKKKQPKLIQLSYRFKNLQLADYDHAVILASVRDLLILFCIDMMTLAERITGHSPAFEGIRLVKERNK